MRGFPYNSYINVFGKHFSTRISINFVNKDSIERVILHFNASYGSLKGNALLENASYLLYTTSKHYGIE